MARVGDMLTAELELGSPAPTRKLHVGGAYVGKARAGEAEAEAGGSAKLLS